MKGLNGLWLALAFHRFYSAFLKLGFGVADLEAVATKVEHRTGEGPGGVDVVLLGIGPQIARAWRVDAG